LPSFNSLCKANAAPIIDRLVKGNGEGREDTTASPDTLFFLRKTDFYITKTMHGNKTNKKRFATTLLRQRRDQTPKGVGSEKNNRMV